MDNLEEITVYPQNISNKNYNIFNISKGHPIIFIIIVIIVIFFFINNRFSPFSNDDFKDDLEEIEKYVDDCRKGISYDPNLYTNVDWEPQISIIIPLYNANKLIDTAYKSILNQSFKKVELIFINDFPSNIIDNDMINNLQDNDKRIVLIKNKKNRGSFYSRNRGAFLAKGKYLQFLDPDDLLVNNILEKSFNLLEKNDLDVVQYPYIREFRSGKKRIKYLNTTKGIIYQPELKDIMCYENGILIERLQKNMLWDKLIKKEVFINALRFIGKENIIEKFAFSDDILSVYAITNVAKSLTYINEPGYYHYVYRNGSFSGKKYYIEKSNQYTKSTLKIIKLIYEKADNNIKSKRKAICFFNSFYYIYWSKLPRFLLDSNTLEIMTSVMDMLINSVFFDRESKSNFLKIRNEIYMKIDKMAENEEVENNPSVLE